MGPLVEGFTHPEFSPVRIGRRGHEAVMMTLSPGLTLVTYQCTLEKTQGEFVDQYKNQLSFKEGLLYIVVFYFILLQSEGVSLARIPVK